MINLMLYLFYHDTKERKKGKKKEGKREREDEPGEETNTYL